jgi:hypothetical protein
MSGVFCISLDYELLWGMKDKKSINNYGQNILGVREAIPQILSLFSNYQLAATWATVGFLFCKNRQELLARKPSQVPKYKRPDLSSYSYFDEIGQNEQDDPYHYGQSMVQAIMQTDWQEIGSHSFSHFYCCEEGASAEAFKADTIASKEAAKDLGISLESFVFPRNQFSKEHVAILKQEGIEYIRGNEAHWAYHPGSQNEQSKSKRAFRLLDSYINLSGHHTYPIRGEQNVPASRFLRPYTQRLERFDALKLRRIKRAMTFAAKHHQLFHLWWHPHNFGVNIEANIAMLDAIASHFRTLKDEYDMQSRSMNRVC